MMSWMYQNKGYHEPIVISKLVGLEPPTTRRMLKTLLKAEMVMARPTAKGNEYRTTPKMFEKFLKNKRKELRRFKKVHLK
jgi:DNA-binding IclR family transcriptional regulator